MRDIDLQATEDFKLFATRVDTGAPADVASIAVSAYPDNSTTQITAGITTTQPFDSLTGFGNVRVVATVANGYGYNSTYALVITTGTVNSVSVVGAIVGEFTIGKNRPGLVRMGLCQASTSTTCVLDSAAALGDDIINGAFIRISAGTGAGQSRFIDDYVTATDTATVSPAWTTTPSTDSVFQVIGTPPASTGAPIPASLGSGAITSATFGAGAITAGTLASATITAAKVADGTITSGTIAAAAITAASLGSNTITSAKVATGTITTGTFAAGAIDAASIASAAITSAKVADGTITAGTIASNAITSAKVATGTITTGTFAAGAIDAASIASAAFTSAKFGAASITAATLGAASITAATLGAAAITAGTLGAASITAATLGAAAITAATLGANTITAGAIASSTLTAAKFSASSPAPVNILMVNSVTLQGAGTAGDKWRPV